MSCAMSVSVDHISAVHVDNDFFFTYLTCRCETRNDCDWNTMSNSPVAYHFLFPSISVAVSIRPGDLLVFNPKIPHCVSHKLTDCGNVPVYLASFYVKCGNIGGNNNDSILTEKEKEPLEVSSVSPTKGI